MKQLKELEEKIVRMIQQTKDLRSRNENLSSENKELKEKCEKMQMALPQENSNMKDVQMEKDAIKSSIEELISTIGFLEESYKESTNS